MPASSARTGGMELRPSEFWALREVSFDLYPGDCIGLVGANGAGKSTLFSILSSIYGPTQGRVEIRGKLQALIALGAGFHPMFTGRENIYINASIFGLSTREIDRLLDRIIEFAELGDFIDAPVRTYSSGMLVRLGFSVAAHLDPDVLLIDEVLAVGDSKFQVKCQEYTRKLRSSGKAIMLVSHYMQNIQGMCTKAIWLDHGGVMRAGDVHEVTDAYQRHLFTGGALGDIRRKESAGGFSAILDDLRLSGERGDVLASIDATKPVRLEVRLQSTSDFDCGRFYVTLASVTDNISVCSASMLEDGHGVRIRAGENRMAVDFSRLPVVDGFYRFYVCLRDHDGVVALSNGLLSQVIEVRGAGSGCRNGEGALPLVSGVTSSLCRAEYRWDEHVMSLHRSATAGTSGGIQP
jgi:lipopolysaccharide transport system ATP-binding protein